ncbi:MAG TPA: tryptophan-rich sensory protein [Ornithinibacter sp.]|nr:tryptophan-rich sensory protein [Ornithinibacter sp.]
MTAQRVGLVVAVLVVVATYAVLAVRWTGADPGWYASLPRPRWQPPDLVFGVVWPLSFGALAVVGGVVALQGAPGDGVRWVVLLAASVALALGWAHEFYVPHRLGRAAVLLAGAALLTWLLVALTAAIVPWAAWLLVPYASWLSVATGLAVGYWRLSTRPAVTAS